MIEVKKEINDTSYQKAEDLEGFIWNNGKMYLPKPVYLKWRKQEEEDLDQFLTTMGDKPYTPKSVVWNILQSLSEKELLRIEEELLKIQKDCSYLIGQHTK